MDSGSRARMTYDQFSNAGFAPSNGFASRPRAGNPSHLSVALPPPNTHQPDNQTPRTTSRSHLLAGLRTAPKPVNPPASAPYSQSHHGLPANPWGSPAYDPYARNMPQTATGPTLGGNNMYAMQAAQQTYTLPEQVLAPPSLFDDADDMDPNVLEQLQMTGMFLAQRQQQLQQQLASITAAGNVGHQQYAAPGLGYQAQAPIQVPGQPGLYLVQNSATGQFQYVQAEHNRQQSPARLAQTPSGRYADGPRPVFRAEISPPPFEDSPRNSSPAGKSRLAPLTMEHVEPLPPPSANAFRRGHVKKPSLAFSPGSQVAEGPKTSSAATFGSSRIVVPAAPMTGTFGPGAGRAGEHPVRQPRGPPPLEELIALPTANHEGSKNFAARRRRQVLNLVRASSSRRTASNPSPTSDGGMSLAASEEDEPGLYRKQSPIGSERSIKRGSQSSVEDSSSSEVQTPATEDNNVFDMSNFVKQLPAQVQQGQERRKMVLGNFSVADKRKSTIY